MISPGALQRMKKISDQSSPDEPIMTSEERNARAVHWAVCEVFKHQGRSIPSFEVFRREYDPQDPYCFYKQYGIMVAFEFIRSVQDEHMRRGNPYVDPHAPRLTYAQSIG
jgi:hypothetical protein